MSVYNLISKGWPTISNNLATSIDWENEDTLLDAIYLLSIVDIGGVF